MDPEGPAFDTLLKVQFVTKAWPDIRKGVQKDEERLKKPLEELVRKIQQIYVKREEEKEAQLAQTLPLDFAISNIQPGDWQKCGVKSFPQILRAFFKYVIVKSRCRDNIGLLQDEYGHHLNRDMDKAEMFNVFLALFSRQMMDQGGLSALNWRTMIVRTINSQWTLNFCRICCCSPMPTDPWGLMGFIQTSSNSWLLLPHFLMVFEQSWESGEVPGSCSLVNIIPIFKKG
ncbi:hypothetical protein DUI87_05039 [Hirundo rustica rustica]|uniref:Uncharacterized protein n=1 Tax=Hirundo rustica rustica TaxID=333673 RepID=A0A3M0KY39_HIRRU|nr:hypothetical protein DUI87_05039 [Hirundo rustica rustica]